MPNCQYLPDYQYTNERQLLSNQLYSLIYFNSESPEIARATAKRSLFKSLKKNSGGKLTTVEIGLILLVEKSWERVKYLKKKNNYDSNGITCQRMPGLAPGRSVQTHLQIAMNLNGESRKVTTKLLLFFLQKNCYFVKTKIYHQ